MDDDRWSIYFIIVYDSVNGLADHYGRIDHVE